jgi:hypothetical protein
MMRIPSFTIKLIAASALSIWAQGTFSQENATKSEPTSLLQRIDASAQRLNAQRHQTSQALPLYALEKAQCWLDFARHEDLRNNRTLVPELAWRKAQEIIERSPTAALTVTDAILDSKLVQTGSDAPQVPIMRKDLWAQLGTLKSGAQLQCTAKAVACGEVMLVQAAHAHERIDWRYANPYFGMAEDFVRQARQQAAVCKPAAQ